MKIEIFQGARSGASGPAGQAEPYSDEATAFSRKAVLQREVELEMESLDKTGNFIGYMFVPQVRLFLQDISYSPGGTIQKLKIEATNEIMKCI